MGDGYLSLFEMPAIVQEGFNSKKCKRYNNHNYKYDLAKSKIKDYGYTEYRDQREYQQGQV
jgi:hypothetical protein